MANVLDSIPGLGGYLAMQDHQRRSALGDLQGVMGLLATVEQTKQRQLQQQMLQMQLQKALREQQFQQDILGMVKGGMAPGVAPAAPGAAPGQSRLNPMGLALALSGMKGGATAGQMLQNASDPGKVVWRDDGATLVPVYENTGQPAAGIIPIQKQVSPGDAANLQFRQFSHATPSAAEAANIANQSARTQYETGVAPVPQTSAPAATNPDWRDIEKRRAQLLGQYVPPDGPAPTQAPSQAAGLPPKVSNEITAANQKQMFELNSKQYNEFRAKIPELNASVRALERLQALNEKGETFSNAGAEFKMLLSNIGQALGVPINVRQLADSEEYRAQVAELLKSRLASKDYGSGTGISNLDIIAASVPLPELMRSPQGQRQIIQALTLDAKEKREDINAFRRHFDQNRGDMTGFVFPSEARTEERIQKIRELDAQKPKGLAPGTIQDGFRYKGGDPSKRESWEKVQ